MKRIEVRNIKKSFGVLLVSIHTGDPAAFTAFAYKTPAKKAAGSRGRRSCMPDADSSVKVSYGVTIAISQSAAPDQTPSEQTTSDGPRIQPATKIIYKYTYSGDGLTTQTEAQAPYFFVNMDRQRLAESLPDWNIVSFGQDEVVLQKTVAGNSSQHYVVGAFNGYVAVFFREGDIKGNLMEVTKAPVYTFSQNDQAQLAKGINVDGDDNLYKVLQDYDS